MIKGQLIFENHQASKGWSVLLLGDLHVSVVAPIKPVLFMNVKFNHWPYSGHTPVNNTSHCKLDFVLVASPQVLMFQETLSTHKQLSLLYR